MLVLVCGRFALLMCFWFAGVVGLVFGFGLVMLMLIVLVIFFCMFRVCGFDCLQAVVGFYFLCFDFLVVCLGCFNWFLVVWWWLLCLAGV